MFSLSLGLKREKMVAVADIGSGSAALAVALLSKGAPARVIAAERSLLPIGERTKEATIAALGERLAQAGQRAMSAPGVKKSPTPNIEEVYCVVRAPWNRSYGARAELDLGGQKKVTKAVILSLSKQALESRSDLDRNTVFEAGIVGVELNGYPIVAAENKTASHIAVSTLTSDCDPALRDTVVGALGRLFPHLKPVFRSSTRALLTYVRALQQSDEDLVIVEVGSEATTITTIRGGTVDEQRTVPAGAYAILKHIAPSGLPEETLSLAKMIGEDACASPACETLKDSIGRAEPELVKVLGEGLTAAAANRRLPRRLLLITQPNLLAWLVSFFGRIDFAQFTSTLQPFAVETLEQSQLDEAAAAEAGVRMDTTLQLSVALVNREHGG